MKKILALLLAVVMLLGVLVGCNSNTGTNDGTGANNDTGANKDTGKKEDPVTLVVRTRNTGANEDFDRVMDYVNDLLEEKINVRIELQLYANTKELNTQIDLDLAAGNPIDLIWMNQSTYTSNVNEAALLPLNELLEEYAPGLKDSISQSYWNALSVDGEVYAVPNQQIAVDQKALLVQKKVADEYGKLPEHINTMDELGALLDWVAENRKELYGVYLGSLQLYGSTEAYKFETVPGVSRLRIDYSDPTKVVYDAFEWAYKPVGYGYQEIQNGWVRPDTGTGADESADLAAAKYAVIIDTNRPGIETEYQAKYGVEWVRIPVGKAYTTSKSLTSTLFGVPYTSKNPEKAVELLNLLHTDKEVFNALMYGIEGVHYDKVGTNKVALKENNGWQAYTSAWAFGNSFLAYAYGDQPEDLAEETITINKSAQLSPIDGFNFDKAGWESVIANIEAIKTEYHYCYNYDNSAELYEQYMQKLEDAGLADLIAAAQEQLDDYWAEKNK